MGDHGGLKENDGLQIVSGCSGFYSKNKNVSLDLPANVGSAQKNQRRKKNLFQFYIFRWKMVMMKPYIVKLYN